MEHTRATWTDERLDDLSRRVESGFARLDEDLRALRTDINARFDALQRLMIQFGTAMTVAILATLLSVILTRA